MPKTSFFASNSRGIEVFGVIFGIMMTFAGEAGAYGREFVTATMTWPGRTGLSAEYDAETGVDQIYLRQALKGSGGIRLTDSFSDKSLPKWGPKGLDYYYFYDASANRILSCEDGDLFYYLADESSGMNLHMGCAAGLNTSAEVIFSDYPLTGFSGIPDMTVEDYCVAEGANLVFSYDGLLHGAFPVVAELDSGDRFLILHDDEMHVGIESYAYGYVTYYDPGASPGQWVPLEEGYNWDGEIEGGECSSPANSSDEDSAAPEDNEDVPETSETGDDGNNDGDSPPSTESEQSAEESATIDSRDQSTVSATANQSQSSTNTNEINVTVNVDVNVTNNNTATSESSSDFSGTVTSDSSSTETSESAATDESSPVTASPSLSEDETTEPDPLVGDFHLEGSGACSLTTGSSKPSGTGTFLLLGVLAALRIMQSRKLAYDRRT